MLLYNQREVQSIKGEIRAKTKPTEATNDLVSFDVHKELLPLTDQWSYYLADKIIEAMFGDGSSLGYWDTIKITIEKERW